MTTQRTKLSLINLILLLMISANVTAEVQVIDLWKGKVPGAIHNGDYHQTVNSDNGWTKMQFVTEPSMDFYPAPASKSTRSAVIICPGGGYWALAIDHEGAQIAKWLNSIGVTAFVLKYRLPDSSIMTDKSIGPAQDGQRAIRIVRRRAKEWGIDPARIGVMGFSAGGHLASTLATHFHEKFYQPEDDISARPDFSVLIYPVISMEKEITHMGSMEALLGKKPSSEKIHYFSNETQVNQETPPAFLVHSMDDNTVSPLNSIRFALALRKYHVPCEFHLYQTGGHGYGMGRSDNTETSWPEACSHWLRARGLLDKL